MMLNPKHHEEDDNKKSSSMRNPSFRVYYGGVAGSVPFIWESQPGTPKHHSMAKALKFSDESSLPPLTPPPSSFRSSNFDHRKSMKSNNPNSSCSPATSLFRRLLVKIGHANTSSGNSVRSMLVPMDYLQRRRFSSRGSSFDSVFIDNDNEHVMSRRSTFLCFRFGERTSRW